MFYMPIARSLHYICCWLLHFALIFFFHDSHSNICDDSGSSHLSGICAAQNTKHAGFSPSLVATRNDAVGRINQCPQKPARVVNSRPCWW